MNYELWVIDFCCNIYLLDILFPKSGVLYSIILTPPKSAELTMLA